MTLQYLLFWGMESGLLLLRERQRGRVDARSRPRAVPLSCVLAGKALATAVIALLQVLVTFGVGYVAFGVTIDGSFVGFVLLALAACGLAAATGLLVAAIGGTEARARSVSILVILGVSMLGGLWVPAFLLPAWVRDVVAGAADDVGDARARNGVTWQGRGWRCRRPWSPRPRSRPRSCAGRAAPRRRRGPPGRGGSASLAACGVAPRCYAASGGSNHEGTFHDPHDCRRRAVRSRRRRRRAAAGRRAPDLALEDQFDRKADPAAYRGSVVILDLDGEKSAKVAADIGNQFAIPTFGYAIDVTSEESVAAAQQAVAAKVASRSLPPVGALANVAGITSPVPFLETTLELWNKVMAVNATGTYLVTKAFLPAMIDNGWGRIVNMSSVSAQRGGGVFGKVPYSSAKAAVLGFTKALAREVADSGVTVNAVTPGAVDTNIRVGSTDEQEAKLARDIPIGRTATTEEVAAVMTFLSSEDASYLTGTTVDINGGSHIH